MFKAMRLDTQIFLVVLAVTVFVVFLRGVGILTFLPGGIISLLLLFSIGSGVFTAIQSTKRF
jgi:hypothetical protein